MEDKKKKIICLIALVWMLVLSYLLVRSFGNIENTEVLTPTGNVDIFEINCICCCSSEEREDQSEDTNVPNTNCNTISRNDRVSGKNEEGRKDDTHEESQSPEDDKSSDDDQEPEKDPDLGDVVVYDDYKIWDNKDLRIFSNPAYEYQNIIAPGSSNSYAFIIRNNNDFDISANIIFNETNDKKINMQYKLRNEGDYIMGSIKNYEPIGGKRIEGVELPAHGYKSYILDWKWIDSSNDAAIGFDVSSFYKLSITVAAK